jgi:NodT family efflux transporter outer membrane factor (OMF) lipoprotein
MVPRGLIAALLLSGCAVGPDYRKPDLPVAASFLMQPAIQAHSNPSAPSSQQFWQGFHDPVLTDMIERALVQNLDLQIATMRVVQSRALASQAGAALLPAMDASVSAFKEQQSLEDPVARIASHLPGYSRDQAIYQPAVGATWEPDVFGGNHRRLEAANASAQATEAERAAVQTLVVAEVANAYFSMRGAQARIAVIEQEIKVDSDLEGLVDLRLEEGLATAREKAEAEGLVYEAKASIAPLQQIVGLSANRLNVLMGQAPGVFDAPGALISRLEVPPIAPDTGPATLLDRRPDVIAAERRFAASNAEVGVATAEYYPKFSLAALLGTEAYRAGDIAKSSTFQPQALFGVRWRLFDFGRIDAEVAQAKGARAEALLSYRRAMLIATADVEDSMVRLVQSEARQDALAKQADADERARSAAEDAYKGGALGLFEVLEEQRQLIAARDQLEAARTMSAQSAVDTFKALGGGW